MVRSSLNGGGNDGKSTTLIENGWTSTARPMPHPERGGDMKRREFIAGLGGAATMPLTARAQQPTMPVIGFVNSGSSSAYVPFVNAFRQGLRQTGFVEGDNVDIQFRWGENRRDPVPGHLAELVRRKVNVIVVGGGDPGVYAAKSATSTIPIIAAVGTTRSKLAWWTTSVGRVAT